MKKMYTTSAARLVLAGVLGVGLALGTAVAASASTTHVSHARSATVKFSGTVSAYTAASASAPGSLTVADRAGATVTFSTTATTTVTQIGGSGSSLAVNDFVTVVAEGSAPSVALAVTFSAAAPVSFSGVVTAYVAPSGTTNGSITLLKRNLASLTYVVSSATSWSENGGGTATIAVGDFATVEAEASSPTIALAIDFDVAAPVKFSGRVTAYTPATASSTGSLTLKDPAGASLTYTVVSTTVFTQRRGAATTLAVGDEATVTAAASAKSDALSVSFTPAPPVSFYGEISAYSAPSASTPGSITLVKSDGNSATFSVTSSTTISERHGGTDAIAVGDYATVTATRGLPTTARAITFTPTPRPVTFVGRVTAYTAPSGGTNGTLNVRRRDGATLTYVVTSATVITEVGATGESLAVHDEVSVSAAGSDKTVATSITFRAAREIGFVGRVSAYSAATDSAPGSITVVNRAGASLTFSTSASTVITQLQGTGATLATGDFADVHAAAAAKSVALTIGFTVSPPIVFGGRVTSFSAPSGSTAGSLTITKRNGATLTYAVTSTTTIAEINGLGATISTGDEATVVALPSSPSVAVTITFSVPR